MSFLKKSAPFSDSGKILYEKGYCEEYISALEAETESVKSKKQKALGLSLLSNALLFMGRLSESFKIFGLIDLKKLDSYLRSALVNNMVFLLFIQDKFSEAAKLYKELNQYALSVTSGAMKRTVGIYEHISGRYENAVTIFIKILGGESECRYADLCIVKSFLRLDMYERAREISAGFDKYAGMGELYEEAEKIRKKIIKGLPAGGRSSGGRAGAAKKNARKNPRR